LHVLEDAGLLSLHLPAHFLVAQLQSLQEHLGIFGLNWELFHLLPQFFLDLFQGLHVVLSDDRNRFTVPPDTGCPTHPVNIALGVAQIVVNNQLYHRDVNPSGCHVSSDKDFDSIVLKVGEGLEPLSLTHVSMKTLHTKSEVMED
jgi:hypothetical protein